MTDRRQLPFADDAEVCVLGGILTYAKAFAEVRGIVEPEEFYHPVRRDIYKAMCDLDGAHKPIDHLTVAEQMKVNGDYAGLKAHNGEAYFGELMAAVVTVDNIRYHARRIRATASRRRYIEAAQEIVARGYGREDNDGFFEWADGRLLEIAGYRQPEGGLVHAKRSMGLLVERMEQRAKSEAGILGISSGLADLDAMLRGFQPGKLYVFAGRPGMGKSAAAGGFVRTAVLAKIAAAVFSLEMPGCDPEGGGEYIERLVSQQALVDGDVIATGTYPTGQKIPTMKRLLEGISELARAPLFIDDRPGPPIAQLRAEARRWRVREAPAPKPAIIVVDYLQLVRCPAQAKNREREVSEIARSLKELAKELACPVIALSQLNRECEKRQDKRPIMADLRESGDIEAAADVVVFVYRDGEYNSKADKNIAEFIVAKHRGGQRGTVEALWRPQFTRFDSVSHREGEGR